MEGQEKIEKGKNTTKTKGLKVTLKMLQVKTVGCRSNFYFRLYDLFRVSQMVKHI